MKLKWLPIATVHADNCYEFMAQKDKKAALGIYRKMTEGAAFLAKNPYAGPLESSLEDQVEVYRSLVVHKYYKLIYRVLEETQTVEIAAVWDVRRNPKTLSV